MRRFLYVFLCSLTGGAVVLLAQNIPHNFTPGQTISSSQINGNFADLNQRLIAAMPPGSILPSMLSPAQFAAQAGDPAVFAPTDSRWALADGRDVTGSRYETAAGSSTLPDLRGMFLRGLNEGRSDGLQDPGGGARSAGDYQADDNKSHNHTNGAYQYILQADGLFTMFSVDNSPSEPNLRDKASLTASGGAEARPRNISVYYFIKIN